MKAKIASIVVLLFAQFFFSYSYSQSVLFNYAKRMSGPGFDLGQSVTTDANGNAYATGFFQSTVDFDPGPLSLPITSAGSNDIFIQKFDINGSLVWAQHIGGKGDDVCYWISKDPSGNLLLTGYFSDTVDFDPGPSTYNLIANGSTDIFILKLNPSGQLIWAVSMGGVLDDGANSVTADSSGNIYSTGYFGASVDFDPSPLNQLTYTSLGGDDAFVLKLSPNGQFIWAKAIGATNTQAGNIVMADAAKNVYVSGFYYNTVDFDPGTGVDLHANNGLTDMFIEKLDSMGNYVWSKQMGGAGFESILAMALDGKGNLFASGFFQLTIDMDPGAAVQNAVSNGTSDIFIEKMDTGGHFVWVKQLGGKDWDEINYLELDQSGNIYATGFFQDTVDFDPGPANITYASKGARDIFVLKTDSSGNFNWVKTMGGTGDEWGYSLSRDQFGNIYTIGFFENLVDFDPGPGTANLLAISDDIYLQRLSPCTPSYSSITISHCGPINSNNTLYTQSGIYLQQLSNSFGCDSFLTIHLTIRSASAHVIQQAICYGASYFFNNHLLNQTGTYYDTLVNAVGCDSIITLQLLVQPAIQTNLFATLCNGTSLAFNNHTLSSTGVYLDTLNAYQGCDSFIYLHLTVLPQITNTITQNLCAGASMVFNGHIITNAGFYHDTLSSYQGCDSFLTLHVLTVPASTSGFVHTHCFGQTYLFNGQLLVHSGAYNDTLTNYLGCDSIITLYLTELPLVDSTYKVDICSGTTYNFNGTLLSSSGIYHDTLQNQTGCDSVVNLYLTIHSPIQQTLTQYVCAGFPALSHTDTIPGYLGCDSIIRQVQVQPLAPIDTTVLLNIGQLYFYSLATAVPPYTYQWLQSTSSTGIPATVLSGEHNDTLQLTSSGYYALIITDTMHHCTDTSGWHPLFSIGISNLADAIGIEIYPNPNNGYANLRLLNTGNYQVQVLNFLGQQVSDYYSAVPKGTYTLDLKSYSKGVYWIKVKALQSGIVQFKQLVIE